MEQGKKALNQKIDLCAPVGKPKFLLLLALYSNPPTTLASLGIEGG